MKVLTGERLAHVQRVMALYGDPKRYPPAKPSTIEAAREWCQRELGFALPEFYEDFLEFSNGFPFWYGEFWMVPEAGHPRFFEWDSVIVQNRRFRRRRKRWRIASHFFIFGRFGGQEFLVQDVRNGSFHLFSPLFGLGSASEALASFPDLDAFLHGILRSDQDPESPVETLLNSLIPQMEERLRAERRPQATLDPATLPVLEAVIESRSKHWPPCPASPEAIEKAIAEAPNWLGGYPLPRFYRELLPHYNGLAMKAGAIYCVQDGQSPLEWIRKGVKPQGYRDTFLFSNNFDFHLTGEDLELYGRGGAAADPEFFLFGGSKSLFGEKWDEFWVYDPRTSTFHEFLGQDDLSSIFGASISSPDFDTFIRDRHWNLHLPLPEEEEEEKE